MVCNTSVPVFLEVHGYLYQNLMGLAVATHTLHSPTHPSPKRLSEQFKNVNTTWDVVWCI